MLNEKFLALTEDSRFGIYVIAGTVLAAIAFKALNASVLTVADETPLTDLQIAKVALFAGICMFVARFGAKAFLATTSNIVPHVPVAPASAAAMQHASSAAAAADTRTALIPSIDRIVRTQNKIS